MQNNHFHSYITPANESAYRGVPDHLLDFPARNERAAALERERLERERKAREAHEQFQRQQEANARALQGMGSPQAYTPQYTPPSTYGTSQPVSWPQPQRQQPKRSVAPPATPSYSPSSSSSSSSSQSVTAWKRLGLFLLLLMVTALLSLFGPIHQNAIALLFAACALYQLIRFGCRVVWLILDDDYNSDGLTAKARFSRLTLFAMALGLVVYWFGKESPGSAVSNVAYFIGLCLVYQVVRFLFRVLALMNDDA